MLKVLVLVCPIAIDRGACTPETAVDIVRSAQVATPIECAFLGEALPASTRLVPDPRKAYLKIMCARPR